MSTAAPPAPPPTDPFRLRVSIALGGGTDGSLALPRLGIDLSGGTKRFEVGLLAGTSLQQRTAVFVEGRERGELRTRVDDVLAQGSLCLGDRLRGCAGPALGVLLLSGEAKGGLHQQDDATRATFAAGGTLSGTFTIASGLFIGLRAVGVASVTPPTLTVEGADENRSVPFLVSGSLGLGWMF